MLCAIALANREAQEEKEMERLSLVLSGSSFTCAASNVH